MESTSVSKSGLIVERMLVCPRCATSAPARQAVCRGCGMVYGEPASEPSRNRHSHADGPTFRLNSLLLLMVLVGLWLTVLRFSEELAVLSAALAIPALVRTYVAARKHREAAMPLAVHKKVAWFLASLGLMMFVYTAWLATFLVTCLTVSAVGLPFGDTIAVMGILLGLILGLVAATFAAVQVARLLWPLGFAQTS
jgi:hypothetical protein